MDELDKRLYRELNSEIEIPKEFKMTIKNALNRSKSKQKIFYHPVWKISIVASISLIVTVGIVYAGTAISNYIFKQPEKIVGFYSEEKNKNDINVNTVEEKKTLLSETEAREKSKKILERFGYKEEKIKSVELISNSENYKATWEVITENNISLKFDDEEGNSIRVVNDNVLENENIYNYRTTEKQAIETAINISKKYGYNLDDYKDIRVMSNLNSEEAYLWTVRFMKKYGELVNPYETITITFVPEIDDVFSFSVETEKYDNNPIELAEDEAKQIALQAEEKIKLNYSIKNTYTSLKIAEMNGDAYFRLKDYKQYYIQKNVQYPAENYVTYRTNNTVRNAWAVTIEYDLPEGSNCLEEYYTYFVDATTGEIIGGDMPTFKPQSEK